jgi:hexokinase
MGKGLKASDGLQGQDLGRIIKFACQTKGLEVELQTILNDSAACLLSQSYSHLSTRFGLILGTGTNIAVFMPVSAIGRPKFGDRPDSWFQEASQVIVNTELGMYGKDVLPLNRWDMQLKEGHPKPWFQPLEHMVSGMYLGEVCRFVLLEAIETTGVFGGVVPESLLQAYGFDTQTLSVVES